MGLWSVFLNGRTLFEFFIHEKEKQKSKKFGTDKPEFLEQNNNLANHLNLST